MKHTLLSIEYVFFDHNYVIIADANMYIDGATKKGYYENTYLLIIIIDIILVD